MNARSQFAIIVAIIMFLIVTMTIFGKDSSKNTIKNCLDRGNTPAQCDTLLR